MLNNIKNKYLEMFIEKLLLAIVLVFVSYIFNYYQDLNQTKNSLNLRIANDFLDASNEIWSQLNSNEVNNNNLINDYRLTAIIHAHEKETFILNEKVGKIKLEISNNYEKVFRIIKENEFKISPQLVQHYTLYTAFQRDLYIEKANELLADSDKARAESSDMQDVFKEQIKSLKLDIFNSRQIAIHAFIDN